MKNKKRVYKTLLALLLSAQLTSCQQSTNELDNLNNIEYYKKYDNEDAETKVYYKGENIVFTFDNETKESKHYIYSFGHNNYNENYLDAVHTETRLYELYDLDNEELIYYYEPKDDGIIIGGNEYRKILNNNIVVELKNIEQYTTDIELKEWYTLKELKELDSKILESVNNVKKLTK